jgi:HTH-type transcriptional regulator/antitoxin HipB
MLAQQLTSERKCQGLSREQAAAVCNVSPSFIRDAENHPGRCSLGLLLQYMTGLGLLVEVSSWGRPIVPTINSSGDASYPESRNS